MVTLDGGHPDVGAIMMTILSAIYADRDLSFPWYRGDIGSEAAAQAATADLPLVYSWNEVVAGGYLRSFSVSVNGRRMARRLEPYLARAHPAFAKARSAMARMLGQTQRAMLMSLCEEFRSTPRRLSRDLAAYPA